MRPYALAVMLALLSPVEAADPPPSQPKPPAWSNEDVDLVLKPYEHLPYVRFAPGDRDRAAGYWADLVIAIDPAGESFFLPEFRVNVTSRLYFTGTSPHVATRFSSADALSVRKSAFDDLSKALAATDPALQRAGVALHGAQTCVTDPGCDLAATANDVLTQLESGALQKLVRAEIVGELETGRRPLYTSETLTARSARYLPFDLGERTLSALNGLQLVTSFTESPKPGGERWIFLARLWDLGIASLSELQAVICSTALALELPAGTRLYSVSALRVTQEAANGTTSTNDVASVAELAALPAVCPARDS